MDDYLRVVIIGFSLVGKSWLANRLVKAFQDQIRDYQNEDLEETDQVFEENDQIEQTSQICKDNNFNQKSFVIDEKNIEIIETYGFGTYTDTPIYEQIKKIVQSQVRVDYFIYVNPCDYQLQGEILSNFRIASDVCTPQKLFVYLSRDFIYDKNKKGLEKINQTWNEHRNLFHKVGLHTNVKQLSNYLLDSYKMKLEQDVHVIVYSKQFNELTQQLKNEQKYKLENQQEVLDSKKEFDVAIIDFDLLLEKSQKQSLLNLLNDDLFFRKCAVFISKPLINDFTKFYQQHRKMNFMKYNISSETLKFLSRNQSQIDKSYFLKFDFKYT